MCKLENLILHKMCKKRHIHLDNKYWIQYIYYQGGIQSPLNSQNLDSQLRAQQSGRLTQIESHSKTDSRTVCQKDALYLSKGGGINWQDKESVINRVKT